MLDAGSWPGHGAKPWMTQESGRGSQRWERAERVPGKGARIPQSWGVGPVAGDSQAVRSRAIISKLIPVKMSLFKMLSRASCLPRLEVGTGVVGLGSG